MAADQRLAKASGRVLKEDRSYINWADMMSRSASPFNAQFVTEKTQQLILNSAIPISERRDRITETNNGTVTQVDAEYRVRAATDSGSLARLQSEQRGDYISGNLHECGIGIRVPTAPTGDAYIKWGYFKDDTGIYCLYDATGLYFVLEDNGTEVFKVEQANWGVDTYSNLDISDGNVFQFDFVYYGYGFERLSISKFERNEYFIQPVHVEKRNGATAVIQPNLPITVEVSSGTSSTQLDCFVGGRQISTFGKERPVSRAVGDYRIELGSIGTTFLPTVSFRHRTGYENIIFTLRELDVLSDGDLIVRIIRNATLTGASFGTPDGFTADEVASEWDTSATAVSGGDVIYNVLVEGGNKNTLTRDVLPDRRLSEDDTYTVAVRRVSGTNATATVLCNINEAW